VGLRKVLRGFFMARIHVGATLTTTVARITISLSSCSSKVIFYGTHKQTPA